MSENIVEGKPSSKADQWRERIAEQQRSGLSIKRFCKERNVAEHSFYAWRRRLREDQAVHFALVNREPARRESGYDACVEIILPTGERLRVDAGVDTTTLRTVLEALRR
jgi:transposase-like protein